MRGLFWECSSLSDITPLKNWDVSNVTDFGNLFYECTSLSDVMPLLNWNLLNGKNFNRMFFGCNLSGREKLEKWKLPNDELVYIIF